MTDQKKANIIKANYSLQQKVGVGPISEAVVKSSQHLIDNNEVDFVPLALSILDKLERSLENAKNPAVTMDELKELITKPVMELKANAAIFHYDLIGSLASIMLGFLERITVMDNDAIEIVRAHHRTLHMIVVRKIVGDGGAAGKSLTEELTHVCDRYYHKKFSH